MPITPHDNQRYLDLAWRLASTNVSDDDQMPIVVYRGEHGSSNEPIHTRTRAVSFGSVEAANTYATQPNNRGDIPVAPRVTAAYLSIRNPVVKDREDQFIDMSTIADKLGAEKAMLIARRLDGHIQHTCNWLDNFSEQYESVGHLLDAEPRRLSDLYLDAYPVFDDDEIVAWFMQAGFDGAIHSGAGETAFEVEYKVFDRSQIHFALGIDRAVLADAIKTVRVLQMDQVRAGAAIELHSDGDSYEDDESLVEAPGP